ncbi:hypothetical protein DSO57_1022367 [Entomophthora muscae]|uniref:Uncharacterized protein n=1 Tax=Entomophthora muscae TaxID=34485 RepID=A0ACC2TEJ4_9FUNG|nr:hypothetical protein DSO57_1022367 [Entomophthora muscae]
MGIQHQPPVRDDAHLKVSHSPTSSTSSGPNTPTNENPSSETPQKYPSEAQTCLDLLRETEVVRAPRHRELPPEVLDFLASSQEPEEPALLQTYKSLETRSQRNSVEPIVKLKIRYVARDLWQTISFPTNITVAQARDVCLLRCNLWLESNENTEGAQITEVDGVAVSHSISSDATHDKAKKRGSIPCIAGDGKPEFALFWNAAGHWLDDFRRLDSYALRSLDILELQVRSEFIFIQPTLYNEHYAEGHLYKLRGGITPSWRMRWFVLQGRTIWHFRRRKEATPSGSADLSRPFQVQETSAGIPGSTDGKETCLVLKFSQKCWWLRALSPEDLDHWRRILITLHREVSDHCAVHYSAKPNDDSADNKSNNQGSQHSGDNDSGSGVSGGMRIKAGYMHRRTPITHAFRERYFVLRGKELSCYKSDRFDKKNNTARVIALHTVEVTSYEAAGRFYIRIVDKQSGQEDTGFVTDTNRKKKDIRSILSSTKSLPARAASWIGKSSGSQLDTEYLYVDNREDWEAWRSAFESIAMVDITLSNPEDMKVKAAPAKSSSKSIATNLSSNPSLWSKLSDRKSLFSSRSKFSESSASSQPDGPSQNEDSWNQIY